MHSSCDDPPNLFFVQCLQAVPPKQRSYSMRQSGSQKHREHGYLPKSGSSRGGSHSQQEPEVVVNGRGNDSSGDSVGSSGHRGRLSPHGLEVETKASQLGQAANPNRADIPSTSGARRPSYDPAVSVDAGSCGDLWSCVDPVVRLQPGVKVQSVDPEVIVHSVVKVQPRVRVQKVATGFRVPQKKKGTVFGYLMRMYQAAMF